MKKIAIFTSLLMLASISFGATVTWSATNARNPSDNSLPGAGYLGYMFLTSSTYSGDKVVSLADIQEKLADKNGYTWLTENKTSSSNAGATGGFIGNPNTGVYDNGDAVTGYLVVFDASTIEAAQNYFIAGPKETSYKSATGGKTLVFGTQVAQTYTATGWATPVPEPTSLALLAFGLIAVGARRKIA